MSANASVHASAHAQLPDSSAETATSNGSGCAHKDVSPSRLRRCWVETSRSVPVRESITSPPFPGLNISFMALVVMRALKCALRQNLGRLIRHAGLFPRPSLPLRLAMFLAAFRRLAVLPSGGGRALNPGRVATPGAAIPASEVARAADREIHAARSAHPASKLHPRSG